MNQNSLKSILPIYIILLGLLFVMLALILMFYISYNDLEQDVNINAKNFQRAIENYEKIVGETDSPDTLNKNSSYKTFVEEGTVPLINNKPKIKTRDDDVIAGGVGQTQEKANSSVVEDNDNQIISANNNDEKQKDNLTNEQPQKLSVTIRPSTEGSQEKLWTIQIASFNSETRARQSWQEYKDKDINLFNNFEANFDNVEFNNKKYTRIRIGTFTSFVQANNFCLKLKQKKYACLVIKLE